MTVTEISRRDLSEVSALQPAGWSDIRSVFAFYVDSAFCRPIKVTHATGIVGVGAGIEFGATAWIAHVIVDPRFRRRGIGTMIVEELISNLRRTGAATISLIASDMGKPLYERLGFRVSTRYGVFRREQTLTRSEGRDGSIVPGAEHGESMLELDREAAGEQRQRLLTPAFGSARVVVDGNGLRGFYLPELGEGLAVARDPDAGAALLQLRCPAVEPVRLPVDNVSGIAWLKGNGFRECGHVTRMTDGPDLVYHPEWIYSRIGGNFG